MNTFLLLFYLLFFILYFSRLEAQGGDANPQQGGDRKPQQAGDKKPQQGGDKKPQQGGDGKKPKRDPKFGRKMKNSKSYGASRKKPRCKTSVATSDNGVGFGGCNERKMAMNFKMKIREIVCDTKTKDHVNMAVLPKLVWQDVPNSDGNYSEKKVTSTVKVDGKDVEVGLSVLNVLKDFDDADGNSHAEGSMEWKLSVKSWPWKDKAKNCLKFCVRYVITDKRGGKRTRPDDKKGTKEEDDTGKKNKTWQKFMDFSIVSPANTNCGSVEKLNTVKVSNDEGDDEDDDATKDKEENKNGRNRSCYQIKPCDNDGDLLTYDPDSLEEEGDTPEENTTSNVGRLFGRGYLLFSLIGAFYFL